MSRSVNQINLEFIIVIVPESSSGGGSNRNTPFLLLRHPVHRGCTIVHLADFMSQTGIKKDTFGRSCFTRINMRHYTNVSGIFQLLVSFCYHIIYLSTLPLLSKSEMGKSAVCFSHAVHVFFPLECPALIIESVNNLSR
ncbi:hypothetical protein Barb6_03128 [Bacteroidales bacterium Barb6]|nr:hypothetical protein Barb6_03128 [Bacteroidales bacterium Barb6]